MNNSAEIIDLEDFRHRKQREGQARGHEQSPAGVQAAFGFSIVMVPLPVLMLWAPLLFVQPMANLSESGSFTAA